MLVRLRLLEVTRRPIAGFFILVLPVILLLVVGGVFSGGHPFERRRVAVVASDAEAAPAIEALARLPGLRVARAPSERAARGRLASRMADAILVVERDGARLAVRPNDELFGRGLAAALPSGPQLDIVPSSSWGYLHYLFPGTLALTAVITGLYGMGYTMVRYRATRLLKKLATTPLSKSSFIGAQLVARAALVLAQTVLLGLAAWLVFGLPITPLGFAWLLALTALGLVTFMGAGFALACVIKEETNMADVINSISGPLVLLSEVFFSAEELPGPLPYVSAALPSTQLVRLLRMVLLEGETHAAALAPGLGAMAVWCGLTFAVSLMVFRWNA